MAEKKRTRLRICELNPHLLCALCGGYLIDATTIVECLHSFCKTCIWRYLETSNYCPICEVLIHKKRPWQNIRLDHTLQNAVYKLVPGLFKREMQRRRDFYEKNPPPGGKETEQVHVAPERIIFSEDEKFSVSLEFSPNGRAVQVENEKMAAPTPHRDKRFLLCPASVCIGHLKKFVRNKYTLPDCYQIDLFYSDEPLDDTYTLMDVAYIYSWRRENVLTLYYSFYQRPRKRRRVTASATATTQDHQPATTTTRVIKTKAPSSSTNTTAASSSSTTSTVTIVEASDNSSVTNGEGTKTTLSLTLPSSTRHLSLPLPLPRPAASPLESKTSSLGFDEDDDDDDDERPLIIVTDTPSACATPLDTDTGEGESGVTIIRHPRTGGCKKNTNGDSVDGAVDKSSTGSAFNKFPTTTPSSSNSTGSGSTCSIVTVANIPATNCSSSGAATSFSSSSPAQTSTVAGTVCSSIQSCPAQPVVLKEQPCPVTVSSDSARPAEKCPSISKRQTDFSNPVEKASFPTEQANTEPASQDLRPAESVCPVVTVQHSDLAHPSQPSTYAEATSTAHSSYSAKATFQTQAAHSARPTQSPVHEAPAGLVKSAQPAETTRDTQLPPPSHSERVDSVQSPVPSKTFQPAELAQNSETVQQTDSRCLSKPAVPEESSSSKTFPTKPNLSESCPESQAPSELLKSKESSRLKEQSRAKEVPQSADTSRQSDLTAGQSGSSKGQSNSHVENSKKEPRSSSLAKGAGSEASSAGVGRSRSNSSLGIFERIYTVTSNCSASGIKSIFKRTAIVPASASSRRYSDVSGVSPVIGIGERRASTGGEGMTAKGHSDKDKHKASIHKHKTSPTRDNRSSLDALAHLSKNSLFTSAHGNTGALKAANPNSQPGKSLASGSVVSKLSDKQQTAKSAAIGSEITEKRSSMSNAPGNSSEKNSEVVQPATVTAEKSVTTTTCSMGGEGGSASVVKTASGNKPKASSVDKPSVSSALNVNKADIKPATPVITGDLRVRLPKCRVSQERLSTAIDQLKQRHADNSSMGSVKKLTTNKPVVSSAHISSANSQTKAQFTSDGKPLPACGSKLEEDEKSVQMKKGGVDKQSNNSISSPKSHPSNQNSGQNNSFTKKESHTSELEKRTANVSSAAHTISPSSGVTSVASRRPVDLGDSSSVKRAEGLQATGKVIGIFDSGKNLKSEDVASSVKTESVVSAGMKRLYGATSTSIVESSANVSTPRVKHAHITTNTSAAFSVAIASTPGVKRPHSNTATSAAASSAVVSTAGVKRPHSTTATSAAAGSAISNIAGVKRPHSTTTTSATTASCGSIAQPFPSTTNSSKVRPVPGTKVVTSSGSQVEATSASHIRVPSVGHSAEGPEAKKAKVSGSSQFSMSPLMTPTILSSSSVASSSAIAHRSDGLNGSTSTVTSVTPVSIDKIPFSSGNRASGGMVKIRPSGNHAASSNKLLAPGQRVDSLLLRATNRIAAAAAAANRPAPTNNLSDVVLGQKKVSSDRKIRSESVDSRMSFINKTFGGGRSSKETCVSPAASRGDTNFSARHILGPTFYPGVSRAPTSSATSRKSSPAISMTSPRTSASGSSLKANAGACDLSRKSMGSSGSGKEGKVSKEGSCNSEGSSRTAMDTIKLDIPRLSTSSRDSVFASDPESSPTPSPKYSDINRNPIKLEPGSKLCRKETWVSAENGGRRSTGSVGSPNSLGSGPGSPLETERSPARDARRPSDSELLLSQRWHSLHPHPHLLAIPHPRDPATAAAVAAAAALYNGHFKVPAAAKYLPLAPEHMPRSASPDPMPLDYSTSSSSSSSK